MIERSRLKVPPTDKTNLARQLMLGRDVKRIHVGVFQVGGREVRSITKNGVQDTPDKGSKEGRRGRGI